MVLLGYLLVAGSFLALRWCPFTFDLDNLLPHLLMGFFRSPAFTPLDRLLDWIHRKTFGQGRSTWTLRFARFRFRFFCCGWLSLIFFDVGLAWWLVLDSLLSNLLGNFSVLRDGMQWNWDTTHGCFFGRSGISSLAFIFLPLLSFVRRPFYL